MSEYLPKAKPLGRNVKVELDLIVTMRQKQI